MRSPTHFQPLNPESTRYFGKPAINYITPSIPVQTHHIQVYNPPIIRNPPPTSNNMMQSPYPIKTMTNIRKNSEDEHYDRSSKNIVSNLQLRNRYSQVTKSSVRALLQDTNNKQQEYDSMSIRMKTINQQLQTIFNKLYEHDEKIGEINIKCNKLYNKMNEIQYENEKNKLDEDIEECIWRTVNRAINQNQQHLLIQNKLLKTDLDTLKLEVLGFAAKDQIKGFENKMDQYKKVIEDIKGQFQEKLNKDKSMEQNLRKETDMILEKRKSDIQRFEKEILTVKERMQALILAQQNRVHEQKQRERVCLMKCLSFRVCHQMQIYNQKGLKWFEIGSGESFYGIDHEGYLLDGNNKYITDQKGQMIHLNPEHLAILKQNGLMG